jgi:hypothetical protein
MKPEAPDQRDSVPLLDPMGRTMQEGAIYDPATTRAAANGSSSAIRFRTTSFLASVSIRSR